MIQACTLVLVGAVLLAGCRPTEAPEVPPPPVTRPELPSPPVEPPLQPTPDEAGRLLPVDDAARDPSFLEFRNHLEQVVERRDAELLIEALHPEIVTSFGEEGGIADFVRRWRPTDPESALWNRLGAVLALGGAFREVQGRAQFCAPYVYTLWPDEFDAYTHAAVVGSGIPVQRRPDPESAVLTTLDYHIVRDLEPQAPGGSGQWRRIAAPDGSKGYIQQEQLWHPLDYRACFVRHQQRWMMSVFVAGD